MEKELRHLLDTARDTAKTEVPFTDDGTTYTFLSEFISKKLKSSLFRKRNARIIIKNLDEILNYTNTNDIDWINEYALVDEPDYFDRLKSALKNPRFKNHIDYILLDNFYIPLYISRPDIRDNFFNDDMLEYLLDLDSPTKVYDMFLNQMSEETQIKFLKLLLKRHKPIDHAFLCVMKENEQFVAEHILEFAENSTDLYGLRPSEDYKEAQEKLNDFIDSHYDQSLESIITRIDGTVKLYDDTVKEIVKLIIEDVIKNENAKLSDIQFTGGQFSSVIIIGNKVVKVGESRQTKRFPNNPYIVKPLLRKTLENNGTKCFVEVTEKAESFTGGKLTPEDKYKLYKNFREVGLVWTDIRVANIGRLTKDNVIHWNRELEPSNEILGLDESRGNTTLKKGDLVLLDADHIYDENDPKIFIPTWDVYKDLEARYQEEKSHKK